MRYILIINNKLMNNALCVSILAILMCVIVECYFNTFKEMVPRKQVNLLSIPYSICANFCVISVFAWYIAIPLIFILSFGLYKLYSFSITDAIIITMKGIPTNIFKSDFYELLDKYDQTHSKEELEQIVRVAKKYPRMDRRKFIKYIFIPPAVLSIIIAIILYFIV